MPTDNQLIKTAATDGVTRAEMLAIFNACQPGTTGFDDRFVRALQAYAKIVKALTHG